MPKEKPEPRELRRLINFKVTDRERAQIEKNAAKYMGGNVSGFVRLLALNPSFFSAPPIKKK